MAIKPWRGACKEPRDHPPINPEKPEQRYEIDFVYGYRCEDARQNVLYNSKKKVVYMTAALGIIFDAGTRKQLIFGGGETKKIVRKQNEDTLDCHTDDILCLAMSNSRTLVATG